MASLLLVWLALLVAVLLILGRGRRGGALVLSYFLGISLIHIPGAMAYLRDSPYLVWGAETRLGLEATVLGLTAFVVGVLGAVVSSTPLQAPDRRPESYRLVGTQLIIVGASAYLILLPIAAFVPSMGVVISSLSYFVILGLWCLIYDAVARGSKRQLLLAMAALPLMPILTTISGGFASLGIAWMVATLAFAYIHSKRKWVYIALLPFSAALGLSLGVAYFQERDSIRRAVWYEDAGLDRRVGTVWAILDHLEPLDLTNPQHLLALDARLNQNYLVGMGIQRHDRGLIELEYGATVPLWMFIPRAIWPDKPPTAGGQEIVSKFVGERFGGGTSVGAGQVLEFYANFGWPGVICGFLLFGFALMRIDELVETALLQGDVRRFLIWGSTGVAMLQPNGNLMEIMVSVVGAILTAMAFNRWIRFDYKPQ